MRKVCTVCKHLITEQPHVCPSEGYLLKRNRLFDAACQAEEIFSLDELEEAASELRAEDLKQENLAEQQCRVCGEKYDTPHKENCVQRRNPPTPSGNPRILVKAEDV